MIRFVLDSDNTITDLYTPWLQRLNEDYGEGLTTNDILSWDIHRYTRAGMHVYDYLKEPGLFRHLKPLPHAVDVIYRLSKEAEVIICTHISTEQEEQEKVAFFREHLPFLPPQAIHFTTKQDKNAVDGDVLFDDAAHNIRSWPRWSAAIRYAYNSDANPTRWVSDWLEFEKFANEIITGKAEGI